MHLYPESQRFSISSAWGFFIWRYLLKLQIHGQCCLQSWTETRFSGLCETAAFSFSSAPGFLNKYFCHKFKYLRFIFRQLKCLSIKKRICHGNWTTHAVYTHTYCVSTSIKNKENCFFKEKIVMLLSKKIKIENYHPATPKLRRFHNTLCCQRVRMFPAELFLLASFWSALAMRKSRQDLKGSWSGLSSRGSGASLGSSQLKQAGTAPSYVSLHRAQDGWCCLQRQRSWAHPSARKPSSPRSLSKTRL